MQTTPTIQFFLDRPCRMFRLGNRVAGDTRRKISDGTAMGTLAHHVPYRELSRVDLKLGDRDIRLSRESQKQKGSKTTERNGRQQR